jgi:putative ABC transport system permease protein
MIRNYCVTAFRNLIRHKINSLINLGGLALALAVTLFIYLYIHTEVSYEKDYPGYENIYRLCSNNWAKTSPSEALKIKDFFPGIVEAGRLARRGGIVVVDGEHLPAWDGYYADPSVLKIFSRQVLRGNIKDCLVRPHTIVVTETTAHQWFGQENPVGKTVKFADGPLISAPLYEITGVIEDFPENSHLKIGYLISMPTMYQDYPEESMESTLWMVTYTYLTFTDKEAFQETRSRLPDFEMDFLSEGDRSEHTRNEVRKYLETTGNHFDLMPVSRIHLYSHREQEMGANGNIIYIYIFAGLALLILLVASANYVNIFISQALRRAKEIGIRQVTGASKRQVMLQFFFESYLTVFLAFFLALLLCFLGLPAFNSIASQNDTYGELLTPGILAGGLMIIILVGVLSGAYPSLYLSGMGMIRSIRISRLPHSSFSYFRKALIVFQFISAIFMIISTLVILNQLQFLRKKDLGFDHDHLVAFSAYGDIGNMIREKREFIYDKLLKDPGILEVCATSSLMGEIQSVEYLYPDGKDHDIDYNRFNSRCVRADDRYLETFGLELTEGRNFNPVTDSTGAFIINRRMAEALELEHPVGTMATNGASGIHAEIVGVVKDFNFASLHSPVEPLIIEYNPDWTRLIVAKLDGRNTRESLKYVEDLYQKLAPGSMFTYDFIDRKLNDLYGSEDKMGSIFNIFSILAIFISCLGLYGLSAWSAELRSREIGIRKAFGASVGQVMLLLSKSYLGLILIAFLVAVPVSNYFVTEWLKSFAYHITISWWIFILSGVLATVTALIAVWGKSYAAARVNPVQSLKME